MSGTIINDSSLNISKKALDGLARRQEAISNNVANADTPGYQATTVNFETAIKTAMGESTSISLQTSNVKHIQPSETESGFAAVSRGGTARADGNNVDIDVELMDMTEVGVKYQAISQVASKKLALLKAIASAR